MSTAYTESMNKLMEAFQKLPGIGPRTAQRLAYHVLKQPADKAMELADAIKQVKVQIRHCSKCYNLTENDLCDICSNANRDTSVICIVEQHNDLISLEETGMCNWTYHVLLGHLAPLEGITPDDLTINALIKRIDQDDVKEIIMATNPNMEGDGTALYISSLLSNKDVKITRLARGLPSGGSIEYATKSILNDAIIGREKMQ